MTDDKSPNIPRLVSLLIAFLGCVVTAVPILLSLENPAPVILFGAGVTVVALGLFLFFSL